MVFGGERVGDVLLYALQQPVAGLVGCGRRPEA